MQGRHRRIADAALGLVDDALERQVVIALRDQAQIGHRIANFLPLIEARAADHAIGQAERDKPVFKFPHLEGRAHQDRHLRESVALAMLVFGIAGDIAGFFFGVPNAGNADFLAGLALGPQRLAQPALVGFDQAGRRAQNRWRAAVVAFQPDDLGAGKVALEAQDVFHFGAAPAIDGLVVIAHHADIARALGQQVQPQILDHVGVLVFVHQHVAEAVAVIGQDIGLGLEDVQGLQQEIAEVGGVQRLQPLLILVIQQLAFAESVTLSFSFGDIGGPQSAVLPAIDHAGERAGRPALLVHAFGFDQLLHQAQLVVGVENGEIALQSRQFGMTAQHLGADGMKGAQPLHAFDHAADQGADALLHLARRLVGEGDAQDLARPGAAGGQDMGQARGQHPGLAGAGAGQHQHGAVHRLHRFALFLVQAGEIGRLARNRRGRRWLFERRIQRIGIAVAVAAHGQESASGDMRTILERGRVNSHLIIVVALFQLVPGKALFGLVLARFRQVPHRLGRAVQDAVGLGRLVLVRLCPRLAGPVQVDDLSHFRGPWRGRKPGDR